MITLLVAMDEDRLIGRGEELPWRLAGEMRVFRERTMGRTVVMGRNTWRSLHGPGGGSVFLDGRVNFVVTHDPAKRQEQIGEEFDKTFGPHFVDTIELAIARARREFPEFVEDIFIIGGREIYELALRRNLLDRMIISHVRGKHIGDVYFPQFGGEWLGRSESKHKEFEIIEYVKRP